MFVSFQGYIHIPISLPCPSALPLNHNLWEIISLPKLQRNPLEKPYPWPEALLSYGEIESLAQTKLSLTNIPCPAALWLQGLTMALKRNSWRYLKGCGMGRWLVLVSPCFKENVVATCKIGSFLCSLDNSLQKNVIVLFFGNQISKWRSFEKRAFFDILFTFSSHQGKVTNIPSAHIWNK